MAAAALRLSVAPAADSPSSLEEITVTAQKRTENLQDVPIALTAIDSEELSRRGLDNLGDVIAATPTISSVPYVDSSNTFFLYMRGVGFVDPGQIGSDGSVGFYQDGFYIARPQGLAFDLQDLARAEILRGPQGTLYGRNTIGGAINLISEAPSGELGLRESVSIGSLNLLRSLTTLDLPRAGDVAARLTFVTSSIDGFVRDPGAPHDFAESGERGGRLRLRWDATSRLGVDYFFDIARLDSTPQYVSNTQFAGQMILPGLPYVAVTQRPDMSYRPINLPLSVTNFDMHGLTATWTLSDSLVVKSLSGFRELQSNALQNYNEAFGLPDYRVQNYTREHQLSQELQATGFVAGGRVNYVAGAFLFKENASARLAGQIAGLGNVGAERDTVDSKSAAVYGQITWAVSHRVGLTAGGRYTRDRKMGERTKANPAAGFSEDNASSEVSYGRFTPAFTLDYHWTQDLNSYARIASGYKSGAPNFLAPIGRFYIPYGPESLISYEVGAKSLWFGHRFRLNVAAFDTDYRDVQRAFQVAPYVFDYDALNIGRETILGVELEAAAQVGPLVTVSVNYAYLNARIDRLNAPANTIFDPAVNPYSPYRVGEDIKGLFDAGGGYAPRNSFDIAADTTLARVSGAVLTSRIDFRWQGERQGAGPAVPGSQFAMAPAISLLNARLNVSMDMPHGRQAQFAIWVKNLLNDDRPLWVNGTGGSIVPISPAPAGFTHSIYGSWVEPRTYGVSIRVEL